MADRGRPRNITTLLREAANLNDSKVWLLKSSDRQNLLDLADVLEDRKITTAAALIELLRAGE